MCGIAGMCGRGVPVAALASLGDALAHRGPDGDGFAVHDGRELRVGPDVGPLLPEHSGGVAAGLAHRRLTIIDLTDASAQPMVDPSGRIALAYNGELYNYAELRTQLEALGHA